MKRSRVIILLLLVLILGCTAAYAWYPPFRLFLLVASGRSPVCPVANALRTHSHLVQLTAAKDRILSQSHLVRTDAEHGLELWSTPKGEFWIPAGNKYVLPFNLAEMERQVYGSGEHFIRAGDIVLDCGASDGDFTREALKAGASLVVAIEIAPKNLECLRRNLAAEVSAGRVIVYPKGVWDKEDQLTLNVVDDNFAANSVVVQPEGSHRTTTVPLTTIDRIATELNLQRVDFIKMDVEGAEARAIAGARDVITRFKPRLSITTEHSVDDEHLIPEALQKVRTDYTMECGPCIEAQGYIRADVLYFY